MGHRDYDSTVARMAGNIIGHLLGRDEQSHDSGFGQSYPHKVTDDTINEAVQIARKIVQRVRETEEVKQP